MKRKLTWLDLFCGAGGLSKGFLDAGYDVVLGVDHDDAALKTFQENHEAAVALKLDLFNHENLDYVVDFLKEKEITDLDVLIGGPPCQGFSYAGKMDINDKRNFLYLAMVKLTKRLKPKAVLLENVLAMIEANGGVGAKRVIKDFGEIGYKMFTKVLFAPDYGVPQVRRRVFFVGLRDTSVDFEFPEPLVKEENYVTYASYKRYLERYKIHNLEETEYLLEKQRMIKDDEEIALIEKACYITDECFKHICNYIKIGKTEKEIAFEIEKFFVENGADGLSFDTIVASGKNSSKPHAVPTDKKIEAGDPITIDMGCKYKGYCSDMTRTIFAGYVPVQAYKIYDLVLKNQLQTLKEMKEDASIRMISRMVENDFKLNGYDLIHSLGHGVGLDIHEMPYINGKNDNVLKTNMVVTNEPGIYLPNNFGVRIEDTVLITKSVSINLTKSDKNYIIVDNT